MNVTKLSHNSKDGFHTRVEPPAGKTDGGRMMIGDALGKGFDFRELMNAGAEVPAQTREAA